MPDFHGLHMGARKNHGQEGESQHSPPKPRFRSNSTHDGFILAWTQIYCSTTKPMLSQILLNVQLCDTALDC